MFILCATKIPQSEEVFKNHASYVDGWLECIKNDSNAILKATADVNRAADYILMKAGLNMLTKNNKEFETVECMFSVWLINKDGQRRGKLINLTTLQDRGCVSQPRRIRVFWNDNMRGQTLGCVPNFTDYSFVKYILLLIFNMSVVNGKKFSEAH